MVGPSVNTTLYMQTKTERPLQVCVEFASLLPFEVRITVPVVEFAENSFIINGAQNAVLERRICNFHCNGAASPQWNFKYTTKWHFKCCLIQFSFVLFVRV